MRLMVPGYTLRRTLRWLQRGLFLCAALLFAYCGFVLLDTWRFQRSESQRLEQLRTHHHGASSVAPPVEPAQPPPVADGTLIGRIQVARIGLSAIVIEGTSRITLRRAVGHIANTALPGRPGNIGLAGHRDSFFRPLRDIRQDDIVSLTTESGEYRYRVVSTTIVNPNDVGVLAPDQHQILTLVTCYPFSYVGPAPSRFIVRAKRV